MPQRQDKQPPGQTGAQANRADSDTAKDQISQDSATGKPEVDGNVKSEQADSSNRKGGRRRRSPYKTGGSKPRPERGSSQTQNATPGDSQPSGTDKVTADNEGKKTPAPAGTPDVQPSDNNRPEPKVKETQDAATAKVEDKARKPETHAEKPSPDTASDSSKADVKPTEKQQASPSANASETAGSKPEEVSSKDTSASNKDTAANKKEAKSEAPTKDKTAGHTDTKPAKTTKRKVRKKKAGTKKAPAKKVSKDGASDKKPAEQAKPAAAPAVEKDSHGIYTLKAPPSE